MKSNTIELNDTGDESALLETLLADGWEIVHRQIVLEKRYYDESQDEPEETEDEPTLFPLPSENESGDDPVNGKDDETIELPSPFLPIPKNSRYITPPPIPKDILFEGIDIATYNFKDDRNKTFYPEANKNYWFTCSTPTFNEQFQINIGKGGSGFICVTDINFVIDSQPDMALKVNDTRFDTPSSKGIFTGTVRIERCTATGKLLRDAFHVTTGGAELFFIDLQTLNVGKNVGGHNDGIQLPNLFGKKCTIINCNIDGIEYQGGFIADGTNKWAFGELIIMNTRFSGDPEKNLLDVYLHKVLDGETRETRKVTFRDVWLEYLGTDKNYKPLELKLVNKNRNYDYDVENGIIDFADYNAKNQDYPEIDGVLHVGKRPEVA